MLYFQELLKGLHMHSEFLSSRSLSLSPSHPHLFFLSVNARCRWPRCTLGNAVPAAFGTAGDGGVVGGGGWLVVFHLLQHHDAHAAGTLRPHGCTPAEYTSCRRRQWPSKKSAPTPSPPTDVSFTSPSPLLLCPLFPFPLPGSARAGKLQSERDLLHADNSRVSGGNSSRLKTQNAHTHRAALA